MKRLGNLWARLVSFANLTRAAQKAARGKRLLPNVARFWFDLERNLVHLQDELDSKKYAPGPYHTFHIFEPKERLISAAPFRDRVVHHALCQVLEPIFERVFIDDSYACRRGKGTHAAVRRFTQFARRWPYVLKCDVTKYFPSIDHAILKEEIARKIKDEDVRWLVDLVIDHANPQETVLHHFPGDDLFSSLKGWLAWGKEKCRDFLAGLRLRLHEKKSVISRVNDGTRFLGYRVFPEHRLLPRANLVRFKKRLKRLQAGYACYGLNWPDIERSLAGWIGHAQQADTWRLRERLFAATIFQRRG